MAPLQHRKALAQQLVQKHQLAAGQLHFGLRHQLARQHPSLMPGHQRHKKTFGELGLGFEFEVQDVIARRRNQAHQLE